MADKFLTLLELTKRRGTDAAVGLVEEVNTVAPEMDAIKGRTIKGLTYKVRKRTVLPAGPAFRLPGEGSSIVSSTYDQIMGQCFFMDAQMQVDEALIKEQMAEGNEFGDILADEATGVMRTKAIAIGDQFYRGTTADAKGFVGLQSVYDTANCEVSAGGNSGSASSAWLVWNDVQGVHFVFGEGVGLEMGQWAKQQVAIAAGGVQMAWVNNLSGYIGLACNHTRSVVRIKLLTTAKPLTDALVAEALSKMPIFMRSQKANLKLFVNSNAQLQLQKSRSTVTTAKTDSGILQFADPPISSNGVPIILTDSLPNNE